MNKKINFHSIGKISSFLIISFFLHTSTFSQNTILGKWKVEHKPNVQIEISLNSDALYYGKLLCEEDKTENIGTQMLKNLKFNTATNTYKGILIPPGKDVELNATLTLLNTDKIQVVAKKLFITKTFYFIRIKQ